MTRALVGAALGLAAVAGVACTPEPEPVSRVLFITIDTLRADHLGFHGYPRATSPFLDELSEDSVVFDRAMAQTSVTVPSHAAMFTGLHPRQLGVRNNAVRLPAEFRTLAEILADAGFRTGAAVASRKLGGADLHQGFEAFLQPEPGTRLGYDPADVVVDRALSWLAEQGPNDRLFFWMHLFDPHDPYEAHDDLLEPSRVHAPERRAAFVRYLTQEHKVMLSAFMGRESRMLKRIDLYDQEIRFVDEQLSRFHASVEALGLDENTMWIITSDHGEGLGNHGLVRHGPHVYQEQLHVPLLIHFGDGRVEARRIPDLVEHVDLLPTVVEILGLDLSGTPHADALRGVSRVDLITTGETAKPERLAFAQRERFTAEKAARLGALGEGEKSAIQDAHFKLIDWTARGDEFFDLQSDPRELDNRVDDPSLQSTISFYRDALEDRRASTAPLRSAEPESVDDEILELLKSLGYGE